MISQAQYVPSYYDITFQSLSGPPLFRESYIFIQRRRFLSSIWSSLCITIFQTSFFLNKQWQTRQLKRSLFTPAIAFSGFYQAHAGHFVAKKLIITGSYVTAGAPKGGQHGWGRSLKCLGLIAGVFFSRLTSSLCSLNFALPPSFVFFRISFFLSHSSRQLLAVKKNH